MERDTLTQAAKNELRSYRYIKTAAENLKDEIKMLESSMSASGGTLSAVPIHGGGCRQEDKLINGISRKEKLLRQLSEKEAVVRIIERTLNTLNERERRVIEVAYIMGCESAVDRLCEELCVEEITVHRIKRKALQKYVDMRTEEL